MPDFATPPGTYPPAYEQLAAVVHHPMDGLPIRVVAVVWLAGRVAPRLVTINPTAAPFRPEPDRWWGTLSRHAVLLSRDDARFARHAD